MVVPIYNEELKDKDLKELVRIQQDIIKVILDFENKYILKTNKYAFDDNIVEDPSPTTIWKIRLEDLNKITELIIEKAKKFEDV